MNKINRFILGCICIILCSNISFAQEVLTINNVFTLLEANNYDLESARQNVASAKILTSKYNRGYRPTLGINAGTEYSLNSIKQSFNFNFPDINIRNIQTFNANISANANYLIYDGGQRRLRNEQNEMNLDFANIQVDQIKQQLSFNAAQAYYSIVLSMYNMEVLEESLQISQYRLERSQTYYEFGSSNRVDVLNAKVDVARDSLNVISQLNNIDNQKWQLNQFTLKQNTAFIVDTSFILLYETANLEDLKKEMLSSNKEIASLKKTIDLVNYDKAIAKRLNTPQINATGSYALNYQKNSPKGQLDYNRNNGFNIGLSANYNILDGGLQKVQEQLATVDQKNANINLQNLENNLLIQLSSLWNNYQNSLLTLVIEKQNIATNEENFKLVKNLFENGRQNSVEFRQAQLNLLNAQFQYNNARTQAKINEIEIDFLLGK